MIKSIEKWLKEYEEMKSKQLIWELLKYEIRQSKIKYSKKKIEGINHKKTT